MLTKPSGLPEYPGVRRLRHRRLLTYLRLLGLHPAFQSMLAQTDAHMCGLHLRRLVAGGLWSDALAYVRRFLPPDDGGVEGRALIFFLNSLWAFTNIVASARDGGVASPVHLRDIAICTAISRNRKLFTILNGMLSLPIFRASFNWELLRHKASSIAYDLAVEVPELRRRLQLPDHPLAPCDVLPIGPRRRSHAPRAKWTPGRPASERIAMLYLNKRRSLPCSPNRPTGELLIEALSRAADLIVKLLQACKRPEFYESQPIQSSGEGAPIIPYLQDLFGTLKDPAKNIGTSSVANAGPPTSQPAKISWNSNAKNAGAPTSQPAIIYWNANAIKAGAPTLQPAIISWNTNATNSGATSSQPAEISRNSNATNAGTTNHLSEDGCCIKGSFPKKNPMAELATLEDVYQMGINA